MIHQKWLKLKSAHSNIAHCVLVFLELIWFGLIGILFYCSFELANTLNGPISFEIQGLWCLKAFYSACGAFVLFSLFEVLEGYDLDIEKPEHIRDWESGTSFSVNSEW
jgi:hypothetical protein